MRQNGRVRVVVVDDQRIFRDVARDCLTARGYDVVAEAGCAARAMEAVARHEPDAMLLDVQLGDDDGFAVCHAVTRMRPDLAVVLTSAENNHENATERIGSCGARGFVRKEDLARVDLGPLLEARVSPLATNGT
jgi:DNA-binding NarL/FixJ family response regulator